MFNLIYQLKDKEQGTGLMSVGMANTYPGIFRAYNFKTEKIPNDGRIWQIQNPFFYKGPIITRANDYVFLRDKFAKFMPGKKITNGFSYLKTHRQLFNYYLPTVYGTDFGVSHTPSIGYYARDCRIQSNMAFGRFLESIPEGTKVVTMGTREFIEDKIPAHVDWFHTYSNKEFWKSCSHYFYYRCSDIEDPLPHTLLEAVQSKHRIISPRNKNRGFLDGIDDILSCIDFDTGYFPDRPGEYCKHLDASIWKNFMERMADNGFGIEYSVTGLNFRQWIEENI